MRRSEVFEQQRDVQIPPLFVYDKRALEDGFGVFVQGLAAHFKPLGERGEVFVAEAENSVVFAVFPAAVPPRNGEIIRAFVFGGGQRKPPQGVQDDLFPRGGLESFRAVERPYRLFGIAHSAYFKLFRARGGGFFRRRLSGFREVGGGSEAGAHYELVYDALRLRFGIGVGIGGVAEDYRAAPHVRGRAE